MAGLFDLAGRTALVTGSSRGLGRAMAEGLAGAGAAVVLNGADAGRLAEAAAAMRDPWRPPRSRAFAKRPSWQTRNRHCRRPDDAAMIPRTSPPYQQKWT